MKLAFIAAAAALLAASCCPNAAPAPSKPAYVTPIKMMVLARVSA